MAKRFTTKFTAKKAPPCRSKQMISRRGFITGLIATAAVSAGSIPIAATSKSLGGFWRRTVARAIGPDYVYQMEPGEVLDGLRMPKWAKTIMASASNATQGVTVSRLGVTKRHNVTFKANVDYS